MAKMQTRQIPVPYRGSLSSSQENEWRYNMVADMTTVFADLAAIKAALESILLLSRQNNDVIQQRLDEANIRGKLIDMGFDKFSYVNSFHSLSDAYIADADASTNCKVDTQFGIAYLPVNGINSLINAFASDNSRLLSDATVSVETSWDSVDYSYGATVSQNDAIQIVNGDNDSYWLCKYALPLHSDVASVRARVTITLPNYGIDTANIFSLKPGMVCGQKLISLGVCDSLSGTVYTSISSNVDLGFGKCYVVRPYKTSKIRVELEQSSWVEENGKKVFYLGLQEVGAYFAEFDKTNWTSGTGNSIVLKATAPAGYELSGVSNIVTTPNIFDEVAYASRNVRIRIFPDEYSGSPVLDTSTTNTLSQDFTTPVSTVYIEIQMRYNTTITAGCPFDANSSPWLDDIAVLFTISEE